MDAIAILREQLKQAHDLLEFPMTGMPAEHLHHRHDGATIQSIAAIYSHTVITEDQMICEFLRNEPPRFDRDGWAEKTGLASGGEGYLNEEWTAAVANLNIDALREYAQLVYADSDACLATHSAESLDPVKQFGGMGEMSVGSFWGTIIVWHAMAHGAEIAALTGCLGRKGVPF
ncbi:MAG TPA: DinB family protein [Thermomicrobiales bacterium]|nr:DinB family protein [Thermomicrobiales bacterium]